MTLRSTSLPPEPPPGGDERTREGTRKRPPNPAQEEAGGAAAAIPDQTAGAGPIPLDQSNETDMAQRNLRGGPDRR